MRSVTLCAKTDMFFTDKFVSCLYFLPYLPWYLKRAWRKERNTLLPFVYSTFSYWAFNHLRFAILCSGSSLVHRSFCEQDQVDYLFSYVRLKIWTQHTLLFKSLGSVWFWSPLCPASIQKIQVKTAVLWNSSYIFTTNDFYLNIL